VTAIRDADANVGAEALGGELAWREGDIAGIEEEIEAVLANWMPLHPEVGDGFIEVDLVRRRLGRGGGSLRDRGECRHPRNRRLQGWAGSRTDRAANKGVGGREQSGGCDGADIASFA